MDVAHGWCQRQIPHTRQSCKQAKTIVYMHIYIIYYTYTMHILTYLGYMCIYDAQINDCASVARAYIYSMHTHATCICNVLYDVMQCNACSMNTCTEMRAYTRRRPEGYERLQLVTRAAFTCSRCSSKWLVHRRYMAVAIYKAKVLLLLSFPFFVSVALVARLVHANFMNSVAMDTPTSACAAVSTQP